MFLPRSTLIYTIAETGQVAKGASNQRYVYDYTIVPLFILGLLDDDVQLEMLYK